MANISIEEHNAEFQRLDKLLGEAIASGDISRMTAAADEINLFFESSPYNPPKILEKMDEIAKEKYGIRFSEMKKEKPN